MLLVHYELFKDPYRPNPLSNVKNPLFRLDEVNFNGTRDYCAKESDDFGKSTTLFEENVRNIENFTFFHFALKLESDRI